MVSQTVDVIIIGGGAIGCTAAFYHVEEGLNVALIDKGKLANEASWASADMIDPSAAPGIPWYQETTTLSKQLYDELDEHLHHITGCKIGYGGNGMLTLASTETEAHALRRDVDQQKSCGINIELLTGNDAREQEPEVPEDTLA